MAYDAIIVGGGLAGAALADQLARADHDVLVLERETQFKDRVRGENMLSWGVAAARRLGVLDALLAAGALSSPTWVVYAMGEPGPARDMRATTPGGDAMLNMYHPTLQETVLARAAAAGAVVKRGATVLGITTGPRGARSVAYECDGARRADEARIIVGADGRASQMRAWGGFETRRDPDLLSVAGMLIEESDIPADMTCLCMGPGIACFWAPQGNGRARTYFIYPGIAGRRKLSGHAKAAEFLDAVRSVGIPESWTARAAPIGPLAEFNGATHWVPAPAKDGVVLIGDAAASTDPSWGSGLSLTMTDVEHLASALVGSTDWDAAIAQFAREHDQYFAALHRILGWMTELSWTPGPAADERRARVFARMDQDPTGFPDLAGLGPFGPSDERARRLVLGL